MRRLSVFIVILLGLPGTASGQSMLNTSGLGLATRAKDTRAAALGGVTLGSTVPGVIPGQPASALDLLAATVVFTAQPSWGDYTFEDNVGDLQGTRFPLIGFSFPVGLRNVLTVTAGTAFDQRWSLTRTGTAQIGGDLIATLDKFDSDGGVAQIQAGFARRMSANFSVGASLGLYRGQVTRTFTRQFDTVAVANPIAPFINGGKWSFFGPEASVEALWDPVSVVRLGARVSWSGTLKADPTGDTQGQAREVSMPMEIGAGVSLTLSPTLVFVAGAETANWSNLGDAGFEAVSAGRTSDLGVGLEWSGKDFWAGAFPVRIGYRRTELPFLFDNSEALETVLSGGIRIIMAQVQDVPLTTLDLSWESGSRSAGPLKESFRRLSITFRVSGR
jgi:hypothetical protein